MALDRPTIQDVAREAGVSVGTVDRVIHNRGRVSHKNLQMVRQAIEKLDYRPNQAAQALANQKYGPCKIGISFPRVEAEFWEEISVGIRKAARSLSSFGVELVEDDTPSHDIQAQIDSIDRLVQQEKVDGLLITPVTDSYLSHLESHIPAGLPYGTVIDDTIGSERSFHIGPNNIAMGGLCAKLVQLYGPPGGVNAVILSPEVSLSGAGDRITGFINKTKFDNLGINILAIQQVAEQGEGDLYQSVWENTRQVLRRYPAVNMLYVTYGFGEWAAQAVEEEGLAGRVKIVCHEMTARMPRYLEKGIVAASIHQKPALQWYMAIQLIYDILSGRTQLDHELITAECSIITKESLALYNQSYMDYFR